MARVSVILPVFNSATMVARAIESVFAQTFQYFELIIVDDGSTDATPEVLTRYSDRALILRQPNGGAYVARNLALTHATGELIAFIDADDRWLPHRLESQIALADRRPECALFFGDGQIFHEEVARSIGNLFTIGNAPHRGRVFDQLIERNFIPQSSVLVRRSMFEEFGPFLNVRLGGDLHKWQQIASRYPVDFVDDVVFVYGVHAQNSGRDRVLQYQSALRCLDDLARTVRDPRQREAITNRRLRFGYDLAIVLAREAWRQVGRNFANGRTIGARAHGRLLSRVAIDAIRYAFRRRT